MSADPPASGFRVHAVEETSVVRTLEVSVDVKRVQRAYARAYQDLAKRAPVRKDCTHADLVLEPGKCIKCGLCVQVSDRAGERPGLAMLQRGYGMEVGVPFGGTLAEGLSRSAGACADICPTGALVRRDAAG